MPWPLNGDYYIFREESIKANTPPVSGVYGLYNVKHHILIGASADIREALLRHEKETSFRFRLSRPTGFTFEVCPEELREQRAQELIAEYRPVLQTRKFFEFVRFWKSWKTKGVTAFESRSEAATQTTQQEPTAAVTVDQKPKDKLFYFSRDQFVVLVVAFVITAVTIWFFGFLTGKNIAGTPIARDEASLAKIPVTPRLEEPGSEPAAKAEGSLPAGDSFTSGPDAQSTGQNPPTETQSQEKTVKTEITEPNSLVKETTRQRAPGTVGERSGSLPAAEKERRPAARQREAVKNWTIQVKSESDKNTADVWADRLRTKGYDAFIVAAAIKGQTWYRVRVGQFETRQEAETLRKVLETQEGFSDAFLTGNKNTNTVLGSKDQ